MNDTIDFCGATFENTTAQYLNGCIYDGVVLMMGQTDFDETIFQTLTLGQTAVFLHCAYLKIRTIISDSNHTDYDPFAFNDTDTLTNIPSSNETCVAQFPGATCNGTVCVFTPKLSDYLYNSSTSSTTTVQVSTSHESFAEIITYFVMLLLVIFI